MTLSFGGGAGVLTIPGVSSDGQTPGGITVAGALNVGDAAALVQPTFSTLNGQLHIVMATANNVDGDEGLLVDQTPDLTADCTTSAATIRRANGLFGHQYTRPVLIVRDNTGSTAPICGFWGNSGMLAEIGQAGGLGLFGKTAPAAPRTLAQSVITAITDANAKTAVQAIANALSDMGALTLT